MRRVTRQEAGGTWCQQLIVLFRWQVSPGSSWEPSHSLALQAPGLLPWAWVSGWTSWVAASSPLGRHVSFKRTLVAQICLYLTLTGLRQVIFATYEAKWIQEVYWILEHWKKNLNRQKKKVEQRRTEWNEGVKERDKDQKNRNKEKKQSKNVSLYTGKNIFLIKASFP